jgi:hypothetical protein
MPTVILTLTMRQLEILDRALILSKDQGFPAGPDGITEEELEPIFNKIEGAFING